MCVLVCACACVNIELIFSKKKKKKISGCLVAKPDIKHVVYVLD